MNWLVFSYSLPSKSNSSSRVTLWRRLKRIGAISPKSSVFVLPDNEECLESFQWLAQEVQQAGGEALVMRVAKFEGLSESQLIEMFHTALKEDFELLSSQIDNLKMSIKPKIEPEAFSQYTDALEKFRKKAADLSRIDFFHSPDSKDVAKKLEQIKIILTSSKKPAEEVPKVSIKDFQNKRWVTRPRPHVDRLGCIWLIKRFIDLNAKIGYTTTPGSEDIPFDMKGAQFGHQGNLCSFETMLKSFGLEDPGLQAIAEIIHEIDLRDGLYLRPETEGVATVLKGWIVAGFSDKALEENGINFFEGLYSALSSRSNG